LKINLYNTKSLLTANTNRLIQDMILLPINNIYAANLMMKILYLVFRFKRKCEFSSLSISEI